MKLLALGIALLALVGCGGSGGEVCRARGPGNQARRFAKPVRLITSASPGAASGSHRESGVAFSRAPGRGIGARAGCIRRPAIVSLFRTIKNKEIK